MALPTLSTRSMEPHKKPDRPPLDLEIKDAAGHLRTVWESLEEQVGRENLRFPKELILLGGLPARARGRRRSSSCRPAG